MYTFVQPIRSTREWDGNEDVRGRGVGGTLEAELVEVRLVRSSTVENAWRSWVNRQLYVGNRCAKVGTIPIRPQGGRQRSSLVWRAAAVETEHASRRTIEVFTCLARGSGGK